MPLLTKVFGVGLIIFGLITVLFCTTFPGHQPYAIGNAVVIFGLLLMAIGFFLFFI